MALALAALVGSACGLSVVGTTTTAGSDGGVDASLDGASDDGGDNNVGVDGAVEAGFDASPEVGCAGLGVHAFCDDFDDGAFAAKWTSNACVPSSEQSVSAFGSTKCVMVGGVDTPMGIDHGPTSRVRLEVDAYVDQTTVTGADALELARVEAADAIGTDLGGVRLLITSGDIFPLVCAGGCAAGGGSFTTIAVGWHHLVLDVKLDAIAGSYDLALDGLRLQNGSIATRSIGVVTTIHTMIGPTAGGNTLNTTVYYDNATVDWL
jgi:hypothetical protein